MALHRPRRQMRVGQERYLIEGFQHGVDKIDLTRYDRDGDGTGDLSRADVALVALGNNTTEIHFNGELITIVSDSALTWDDVLL